MILGIDIDGVILDFERTMHTYAEMYDFLILNKKGVVNPEEFDYLNRYNWTKEEQTKFLNDYLLLATSKTSPLPLVKEALTILKYHGYKIYLITSRGLIKSETKEAVKQVLTKNEIPYDDIYFSIKDKVKLCRALKVCYMIEDNPKTIKSLSTASINNIYLRAKNSEVILNNPFTTEVNNWGEILRLLLPSNLKDSQTYELILKKK